MSDSKPRPPIPTQGTLLCGAPYPDGSICRVAAGKPHAHVVALDLHHELEQGPDLPSWSVESRLLLVTGRPVLAREIAATLPHELGARLCDRLETIASQARAEATVELSNAVTAESARAIRRLSDEAQRKLAELRRERFNTPSRLA